MWLLTVLVGHQRYLGEMSTGLPSIARSFDMRGGVFSRHKYCSHSCQLSSILQLYCDLADEEPAPQLFHKYRFFLLIILALLSFSSLAACVLFWLLCLDIIMFTVYMILFTVDTDALSSSATFLCEEHME